MLKRIVMQVHGSGTVLCTRLWAWLTIRLWNPVKSLLASFTHKFQSAINHLNHRAQTALNFKAWVVNQTTAAQSTKQGRSTAKAKATQTGSQLQTTVRPTHQHATTAIKKTNVLVALMKWAASRINASKTALILTVHQWIQDGLKYLEAVRQHPLVVCLSQRLEKVRVTLTNWVLLCIKKPAAALTLMGNRLKAIGLKLQGNAHLLLQRVLRLPNLGKKLAELTKLVQSLLKKLAAALTRMVYLLKVIGLKQIEIAPQLQQPAQRQRSKGR